MYHFNLKVIISDPTDGELHLLTVDLASGRSSPHSGPDRIKIGYDLESAEFDKFRGFRKLNLSNPLPPELV